MATGKEEQKAPGKKTGGSKNIAPSFNREPAQEQKVGPEEFEEDLSTELRMKPQPLNEEDKKNESAEEL